MVIESVAMRTHAVSVGTLLLVFIQLVIIESQRK